MTLDQISVLSLRVTAKTVWTFVRATSADGLAGYGEATLQGSTYAVEAAIGRYARNVHGVAAGDALATLPSPSPTDIVDAAAISAIEQALVDVVARQHGETLLDAVGTNVRDTVRLYANINRGTTDRSPRGFAARAADAAVRGFTAIKVAPFDDVTPDAADTQEGRSLIAAGIERIAAVRDAVGADVDLMVDCHWRFGEAAAARVLDAMAPLRLYWFECPLTEHADNFTALRRLRSQANRLGTRLAGCETLIGIDGFRPFLDAGVYDVVMPDVKYAGGLGETLRIAEEAAARGTACSPHNPSGPIAHAHSVHLSAQIELFPFLEYQDNETGLFFDIVTGDLPDPRRGVSALPQGPGLGVALADDAERRVQEQFKDIGRTVG